MGLANNVVINIYSIMILIVLCIQCSKEDEKTSLQYKLYMMILQITILMLVVDIFSRFDGKPGTIYTVINYFGNFTIFLLNPIVPSLWLVYAHDQVFHGEGKLRQMCYSIIAINMANVIMVVLTKS